MMADKWTVDDRTIDGFDVIGADGFPVAEIPDICISPEWLRKNSIAHWANDKSSYVERSDSEREKLAKLISAAPEMLRACKTVLAFLDNLEAGTNPDDPLEKIRRRIHAPLRDALVPAIAKALGTAA